nr:MAG TPA: hypothetical protein [Caudoviricetes sp.]
MAFCRSSTSLPLYGARRIYLTALPTQKLNFSVRSMTSRLYCV